VTIIGKYKYEIDAQNAVRIWDMENVYEDNAPFFFQPDHPDTTPWESREAAETWVTDIINEWLKPAPEIIEPALETAETE
jgi:hypothetical protein